MSPSRAGSGAIAATVARIADGRTMISGPIAMRPLVALEHSLRMVYPTNRQYRGRAYATGYMMALLGAVNEVA